MSRLESISLLDSDRCSSDNHLEDTLSGYAHASKHHSSRFLASWGQMRPFLARPLDALSTERRPAGPRATFYIRRLIPITLVFGACVWIVSWASPPPSRNVLLPPSLDATVVHPGIFGEVRALNALLPQYNPDLKWPEGRHGRYLNFPDHSQGAGWNNIVREQILQAYLSYLSRRAFVIPPFYAREQSPLGEDQELYIPPSAFSYSPLTGAPFPGSRRYGHLDPPDEQALPRSVSEEYYNSVCPEERRVKLDVHEVCDELGLDVESDSVKPIAEAWAKKLLAMDDGCIDVIGHPLFNYMVFGDRVLSLWHGLSKSPFLANWDWSPLIYTEVAKAGFPVPNNTLTARLRNVLPHTHPWASQQSTDVVDTTPNHHHGAPFIIPGLIAVHVRRGDYEEHCKGLSWVGSEYGFWSSFGSYSASKPTFPKGVPHHDIRPEFCDPTFPKLNDTLYDPPYAASPHKNEDGTVDPTTLTLEELLFHHCWLELDSIRDRLHAVREWQKAEKGRELKDVYILTNVKDGIWISTLKEMLKNDGWVGQINSSGDVAPRLSMMGMSVNQGVDMAIAHWSEVFLGNGFSSLSGNTVGFRLAQGYPVDSIHLF